MGLEAQKSRPSDSRKQKTPPTAHEVNPPPLRMRKRTPERNPDSKSVMYATEAPKAVHPLARRLWGRIMAAKPAMEGGRGTHTCRHHCCAETDGESYIPLTRWVIFRSWCLHPNSQAGEERGVQNKALLSCPDRRQRQGGWGKEHLGAVSLPGPSEPKSPTISYGGVCSGFSGFHIGCISTTARI